MNEKHIQRDFMKYVSLNIIGMIGLSCYILADTFFVAQGIGVHGLTALNLAIPAYSFIHGTGLMIGMGGATRFAISKSEQIFTQALYQWVLMAALFLFAGLFLSQSIAVMLGADHQTLENTTIYLKTILCFAPFFMLDNIVICFVRNDGNPKLSMAAMLIGSLSNIILDYIFIFPCEMGMFGAALATGVAPVVGLMVLSTHFMKRKNTFHVSRQLPKIKDWLDITFLGGSALITELSSGVVMIVFNMMILRLAGNTGVAAYGIIANIALVVIAIFTGIAQGMQPIVSRCCGTENMSGAKQVLKYSVVTAGIIAMMVYGLSVVFAEPMVAAFNKDANELLTSIATNGMRIYFTAFAFVGINILSATYFSAVGCSKNAWVISLLRGFVLIIPMVLVLAALFGINGVWMSLTVTEFVVLLISVGMIKRIS